MELLDGVENPLHRLRGNAVVIAVNDIGNRRQADADKVGDILHRGHRQALLILLMIHYIMLSVGRVQGNLLFIHHIHQFRNQLCQTDIALNLISA